MANRWVLPTWSWSWARIKRLATGTYVWTSEDGTKVTTEHYNWSIRWSLDGIHSWRWKWVTKYGKRPCGCTINPLTRRHVLYSLECDQHHGHVDQIHNAIHTTESEENNAD